MTGAITRLTAEDLPLVYELTGHGEADIAQTTAAEALGDANIETAELNLLAEGSYYAQPEGSGKVYTLAASTVETLLGASPEALRPDDVVLMDWDSVTSVDLSCGDDIYLYSGATSW